jgi:Na+/H+ antiporter NhaD/arsenite permease-like protein
VTGAITPADAVASINVDVLLFLFGMFVVGEALDHSGYLYQLSHRMVNRVKNSDQLILVILFGMGLLAALLMNDTLAIVCTPLMLYFAKEYEISPKLLLIALAFAVTTGSTLSPIGSPHNLLVAEAAKFVNPFPLFFAYLAVPTAINLCLCYLFLKRYYRHDLHRTPLNHVERDIRDPRLAKLARLAIWIAVAMIGVRVLLPVLFPGVPFHLTWIALTAAAPILLLSRKRFTVLKNIDWTTLVFFAAMFIVMDSVWRTSVLQQMIADSGLNLNGIGTILGLSVVVSQLISNVPFVALYVGHLAHGAGGATAYIALAAGSTIAGNMFILGAASNVIIIQNAEKQGETITFREFARIGVPLTIAQVLVLWGWLSLCNLVLSRVL